MRFFLSASMMKLDVTELAEAILVPRILSSRARADACDSSSDSGERKRSRRVHFQGWFLVVFTGFRCFCVFRRKVSEGFFVVDSSCLAYYEDALHCGNFLSSSMPRFV